MNKRRGRRSKHVNYRQDPDIKSETALYDIVETKEMPLILILDQITDPHNLGACMRSADAAGAHVVVVPRNRAATLNNTVRRLAIGAAESITFVEVTNLARTMRELKKYGVFVLGTADEAKDSIYSVDMNRPLALVMGSEGEGMRRLTQESCDALAHIPMFGAVSCLNVSVAAGVCLFEARRQRGATPVAQGRSLKIKR